MKKAVVRRNIVFALSVV